MPLEARLSTPFPSCFGGPQPDPKVRHNTHSCQKFPKGCERVRQKLPEGLTAGSCFLESSAKGCRTLSTRQKLTCCNFSGELAGDRAQDLCGSFQADWHSPGLVPRPLGDPPSWPRFLVGPAPHCSSFCAVPRHLRIGGASILSELHKPSIGRRSCRCMLRCSGTGPG